MMVNKKTIHELREMVLDSKLFDALRNRDIYEEYKKLCSGEKVVGSEAAVDRFNKRFYNIETLRQQNGISWCRDYRGDYRLINRAKRSKKQIKILGDELAIEIAENLRNPTSDRLLKQRYEEYGFRTNFGGCSGRELVTEQVLAQGKFIRLNQDTPEFSLMKDFEFVGKRWGSYKEINLDVSNSRGCTSNGGWFDFLKKGFEMYSRLERDGFYKHVPWASGGISIDKWIKRRFNYI